MELGSRRGLRRHLPLLVPGGLGLIVSRAASEQARDDAVGAASGS